jgi:Mg/Co/Ni transporter MgtE
VNDAAKMIQVFQMLLAQMEAMVAMMPQLMGEDGRSESLGNQIQSYQTKLARVKNVLRKHQEQERRKREIQRQNKENSRKH